MNSIKKNIAEGLEVLRREGITFGLFKAVVSVLLVNPNFDEDFWVWLYECYAEGRNAYEETVEEWADEHFQEFTIDEHSTELRKKKWKKSKYIKPRHNKGVLIFIPEEDNHVTSGMWDISEKWVLLDDYRNPESEVTHWIEMPDEPAPD